MKRTFLIMLAVMILFSMPLTAVASFWDVHPDGYSLPGDIMVHADKDVRMMYLEYVGLEDGGPHIPEAYFLYYYGTDENGNTVPYPAYCMMPEKPGAGAGEHMVDASTFIENPKIWGIVTNGYPYKTIGELGVTNKHEAYFATKMALWTYILDRDIDDWIETSETDADKVLAACKNIYNEGMKVDEIQTPALTATPDKTVPEKDSIDSDYVSITYSVSSNMHIKGYKVLLNSDVPEGTIITDLQNKEKDVFNSVESFKVMIPSDSIANATGTFEVEVTAELERKAIVHGVSYDKDKQDYALTIPVLDLVYSNPTVTYTSQSTTLEIIKKAAGTNILLAGATFRVADFDGLVIGIFTTGSDGRVVIPLTESGTYQIEEITPPKGYLLSEVSFRNVNVSWEPTTVTFTNEKKPGLSIQKIDSVTGKRVGGAVVRIAKDGGSTYTDVKLDSSGITYLDDMDPGIYTVTELVAPSGYILDDTPQIIKLEPGKTATVTLKNNKRPGITIKKYDEMTSTVLKGAEFSIAKKGGSIIYEGVTDENGVIQLTDLEPGWYTITELAPPEGYIITTQSKDVYLEAGGSVEVKFDNRRKPSIQITKLDEETKQPIEGAVFKLRRAGSSSGNEYITDIKGLITINDLDEGVYIVEEVKSPDGYLNENLSKEVELKWGVLSQVVFTNKAEPALEILKIDEETSQPLEGAVFRIRETESGTIGDYITGTDGKICITGLNDKSYTIEEIVAPDGYLLDDKHRDVKLEWGKTTKLVFTNKAKPSLEILKIDEESRQPLEGAEFCITNTEGKTIGEYITDKDGLILIRGLEESIYTVEEITAPDGYLLEPQHKDISLEWGRTKQLVFTNKACPILELLKIDEETRKPLSGAMFLVTETEGRVVGEYTTDEQGRILISGLKDEIYTISEIFAPNGYLLEERHKDVKLEWGKTTSLIFTNKAEPALEILKIDEETKKPLAGAKFRITATEGGTVSEYITDDNGRILITGLNAEIYSVEEITAPDGYLLEAQHKDILLEGGKTKQLLFTNKARPALEILKLDEATMEPLSGAKFRITATKSQTTGEYITDDDGRVLITDLNDEIYTVEEIIAPDGYLLDNQHKDILLEWGRTKQIIFTNKLRPSLEIKKVDTITGEPLEGARFKVTKTEDSTVSEYITDETGRILILNLEESVYTVEEIAAPYGYLISPQHKEIQLEWGKTKTLVYENTKKPTLIVTKMNALTYEPIPNTTYKIEYEDPAGGIHMLNTYRTDGNGQIILPKVDVGWYTITETIAAPGYSLAANPITRKYLAPGENAYTNLDVNGTGDISGTDITVLSGNDYIEGDIIFNYPLNSIVIRKVHYVTGEMLAGAVFEVRRVTGDVSGTSGTVIGRYTTDNSGVIVISGLQPGGYIVEEVKAPSNFLLSDNSQQQAWLKPDGTSIIEVTFANIPYGSLLITKADAQTGKPLANTRFRVTDGSGAVVGNTNGEFVTDENGEILVPNIKQGSYVVTEIEAPTNYVINTTPQTVNVGIDGKVYKVSFKNQPAGTLVIRKMDTVTKEPLADAWFKVTTAKGDVVGDANGIFKTDASGTITIPHLLKGSYIVEETKAPDGFILENQSQTIEIDYGRSYTLDFYNKKMSGLQIIKIDSLTKQPLKGAEFSLYKQNGELIGHFCTDADGVIIIDTLSPGWYKAVETKSIAGYVLDDTPKDVQITANQFVKLVFENAPMSNLIIRKVDAGTSEPLEGAEFSVKKAAGMLMGIYRTGTDGTVTIPALSPGWYSVTETKAPEGYTIGDNLQTVEITNSKTITMEFKNRPYGSLVIKKIDETTGSPLLGADFSVYHQNGLFVGEYTSAADGTISIPDIEPGWYVIRETKAPSGYTLDNTAKTIEVKPAIPSMVTFANKPFSGIEIIKIDSVTKASLAGAIFLVERSNGEKIGTYKTDLSGKSIVSDLPEGTYIVSEIIAPNGYILDETPKTVIVKSGKLTVAEFANRPLAGLKIIKLNSVTHNPIAGVEFSITKMTGEKVENDFRGYTFKTDRTGQIYVPGLKDGYYTVTEVKAAEGYILDGEPKIVLVQSGKISILEVFNTPMSGLLIIKTDAKTGKPLAGVVFDIKHADGSFVAGNILDGNQPGTIANSLNKTTSTNGDVTGSYTTDANGRILLNGLESGQYTVTERKALDGYELDTNVYNVTVTAGKLATLSLTNKPKGGIRLVKIDSITKKPIQGVEFMLFDSNKKVVDVFYTDDNGVVDISDGIAEGRYTIRETRAAKGYDLDGNPRTVEFKAGVVTEIIWENVPQSGQIQITKKSGNENEINRMPKGTLLEGAVFEAYDYRTGNLVDRFVSGNNGIAVSSLLPLGRYVVKEVKAPLYYKLSGEVLDIEIGYSGQIIRREMVNYSVSLGVYIKKTGNYEAMPGDNIRYQVKAVQNTSNVPLSDFYWRDVLPTDAVRLSKIVTGTYNQQLKYKIMAETNKGNSIIIADNLSTLKNHVIDCSRVNLGLASNEYVTSFTFVFGTVKAKFAQVEQPQVYVDVKTLPNKYEFANKCDVGGRYNGEWVISSSTWRTSIYSNVKLPKTGY